MTFSIVVIGEDPNNITENKDEGADPNQTDGMTRLHSLYPF
jgi:hypothetical protein